ncbi:MAG: glutathione S-transferase [Alphaproteobacteria bacterium]|nr:glutathione S-transferase [Alphaproteobacteria bacterium]MBU2143115.1 glutathione S-transferase [Alphaproteobacteria bacterium]MBU2195827.1 glutathione S-transferase [Alphaproteobacteria bacterium]
MIIVHHLENSRSQRVLWLLEELGLPYEVRRYARDATTMLAPPELKAIHPLGKSPVIEDDGAIIAETGAVFEYILDTYGAGRLSAPAGTPQARKLSYWLHYAEGSAMPPLLLKLVFMRMPDGAPGLLRPLIRQVAGKVQAQLVNPQLASHLAYWESELAETGWFAGADLSAADIMMSFPLEAAASRAGADKSTAVMDFLARIHARPAYQRALEAGGPYAYA